MCGVNADRAFFCADIDWEYPGGNGPDYKTQPNDQKEYQIDAYPILLEEIRAALPKDKLLTIAVPAREEDMIAYTPEKGPDIWKSVDFVNVRELCCCIPGESMSGKARHNVSANHC